MSLEEGDHRRFLLGPEPLDAEPPARRPPAYIEQAHDTASQSQHRVSPDEASFSGARRCRNENVINSISERTLLFAESKQGPHSLSRPFGRLESLIASTRWTKDSV